MATPERKPTLLSKVVTTLSKRPSLSSSSSSTTTSTPVATTSTPTIDEEPLAPGVSSDSSQSVGAHSVASDVERPASGPGPAATLDFSFLEPASQSEVTVAALESGEIDGGRDQEATRADDRAFVPTCFRCGGTVEGPFHSTCKCKVPVMCAEDVKPKRFSVGGFIDVFRSNSDGNSNSRCGSPFLTRFLPKPSHTLDEVKLASTLCLKNLLHLAGE